MTITKCDDKWFYINDGIDYYKCDDVEGIVSCFDVLCKEKSKSHRNIEEWLRS